MVEEKQAFLQNEQEVHAQLRRDIEVLETDALVLMQ